MSIFQKSVILKHLANLDKTLVETAYRKFKENYSPAKIEQIKKLKEEEYQDGFLRDIFVDVLGYTIKPNENYNLVREYKNQADSKKADGAILKDEKAIAVIELKSVKTKDLKIITEQAFNYKNNQPDCKYIITSNFQKLRFYIDYAHEYEEFDLFNLERKDFDLLYLLLHKSNIFQNVPLKLKEDTKFHDQEISDRLYKDYSQFKHKLFNNLCKNHPEADRLTLFKKSQKLLDRFLFILFAEDCQLLPTNSISRIIDRFELLKDEDAYKPLYDIFKQYFGYMNIGRKGKTSDGDIPAYNGGLFYEDEDLDKFIIDDDILKADLLDLSEYDFSAEVDVNILGHIFEHSLNEIEEISAELEGIAPDKSKSKRKKDGVFYTPKYITQYIVENTIGKLCTEKRKELEILEIEFDGSYRIKNKKLTPKGKKLYQKLTDYKTWMISLKIIDPACGSGAFLNQALNFLVQEHKIIDDIIAELTNSPLRLFDVDKNILENNLYGVDINEESVEIAKLSLWLRTAQKGRALSTLNNNIKCGNSLIDDPAVAKNKAFNWQKEFPEIMSKGGFDVVIGNPPYVRAELLGEFQDYLSDNYSLYNPSGDLFSYFYEKSFKLLKADNGLFGFISNTFDKTTAGISIRDYLQTEISFLKYIDFTEVQIFEGATTYPVIITAQNIKNTDNIFQYIKIPKTSQASVIDIDLHHSVTVEQNSLEKSNWSFKNKSAVNLISKLKENKTVREIYGKCYYGVKTALNEAFIIPKAYEVGEHVKPIFEGKDLSKWISPDSIQQLILFESKWTKKEYGDDITEEIGLQKLSNDYPKLLSHILPLEERAKKRYDKGDFFWELRNCAYYDLFEKPKIVFPNLQNSNKFSFDETGAYINAPAVILPTNDKFLLAILNSKLVWYFLTNICVVRSGGYIEVKPQYFEQIPIPVINNQDALNAKTDNIIAFTSNFQKAEKSFTTYIQSQFNIEKLSKKLQNWHELRFSDFINELSKAIKKAGSEKLTKKDEMEWMELFEEKKAEVQTLKSEIEKTDKEIDQMVYELYGLTDVEIKIVEGV
jgi:type I restriction-modification system DNA methylase subunit